MDIEKEIREIKSETDSQIVKELFKACEDPRVTTWVDTNVLVFSGSKQKLLKSSSLKTTQEVVAEVKKNDSQNPTFLHQNRARFEIPNTENNALYDQILSCCTTYSPLVQLAIDENRIENDEISAVKNNKLNAATDESVIFDFGREVANSDIANTGIVLPEYLANQKGIEKSWFKYHNNRERRLSANTYLWTDERILAGGVAEAFGDNRISVILTTDNDMFSIVKQLMDNLIWRWIERFKRPEQVLDRLFDSACAGLDHNLSLYRTEMVVRILAGELTEFLCDRDFIIWLYPTHRFMFYRSLEQFLLTGTEN